MRAECSEPSIGVGINLNPLPGRRVGDVVGVPPLHFEIDQAGARPPCHGNAVARHFARAGRTRMQTIGITGREDHRARQNHDIFAGQTIDREDPTTLRPALRNSEVTTVSSSRADTGLDHLLAAQVHERNAGIALNICGDASDFSRTDHHVAVVVATEIKTRLLQLRIIDALDPLTASLRPFLIDQKLVVILDQKFGRVARLFFGVLPSNPPPMTRFPANSDAPLFPTSPLQTMTASIFFLDSSSAA